MKHPIAWLKHRILGTEYVLVEDTDGSVQLCRAYVNEFGRLCAKQSTPVVPQTYLLGNKGRTNTARKWQWKYVDIVRLQAEAVGEALAGDGPELEPTTSGVVSGWSPQVQVTPGILEVKDSGWYRPR